MNNLDDIRQQIAALRKREEKARSNIDTLEDKIVYEWDVIYEIRHDIEELEAQESDIVFGPAPDVDGG